MFLHPLIVILPITCRARDADPDGAGGAMTGKSDHPHVMAEVLAAKLRADPDLARELEDLLLPLEVAESSAVVVAGRGKVIEVP